MPLAKIIDALGRSRRRFTAALLRHKRKRLASRRVEQVWSDIPDCGEMEDRILLSAGMLGALVADASDAIGDDFMELADDATAGIDLDAAQAMISSAHADLVQGDDDSSASHDGVSSGQLDDVSTELVVIDPATDDYEQLVQDLLANSDSSREFEVFVLEANEDGVQQISELLATRNDIDALHIVSHGTDGQVKLGNVWLSDTNLEAYVADVANWQDALAADADILFYGCDMAATAEGRTFLDTLGILCDCDVAASEDKTGHSLLGGDWDLEYQFGRVDSVVAFSSSVYSNWENVLATYTVTNTNNSGVNSLRWAIDQSNASVGVDDTIDFSIAGLGIHTIALSSDLAFITDTVTIDATTESDYVSNGSTPLIELDGGGIGSSTAAFRIVADNTIIKGFSIFDFDDEGIEIFQDLTYGVTSGSGNTLEDNWIGIEADGTTIDGVLGHGILIADYAATNTVRNNVIADSGASGIQLGLTGGVGDTHFNVVQGNIVGLGVDGVSFSGTGNGTGISIVAGSTNNLIGSNNDTFDDALERNVISNNTGAGIYLYQSDTNTIAGNEIGTDVTGTLDRGNSSFASSSIIRPVTKSVAPTLQREM